MNHGLLALGVAGALVACVTVTLIEGRPRLLPGVALDSPVLLHAERALALFAAVIAIASIAAQAARGRLPVELSTSGFATKPTRPTARRPRSRSSKSSTTICWPSWTRSPTVSTPPTTSLTFEERDGQPADNRSTSAGPRSRTRQGAPGAQRASPRRGAAQRRVAAPDRRTASRRGTLIASEPLASRTLQADTSLMEPDARSRTPGKPPYERAAETHRRASEVDTRAAERSTEWRDRRSQRATAPPAAARPSSRRRTATKPSAGRSRSLTFVR